MLSLEFIYISRYASHDIPQSNLINVSDKNHNKLTVCMGQ